MKLSPRELLAKILGVLETVLPHTLEMQDGVKIVVLREATVRTVTDTIAETLACPPIPGGIEIESLLDVLRANGWVRFEDGPDSQSRAQALVARWYSWVMSQSGKSIPGEMLVELERRIAAQMDVERMVWTLAVQHKDEEQSPQHE